MLIQMRSAVAKIFVFVLFGLLILSFAVWGIGDIFYRNPQASAVAEIGDREIDQREFSRSLSRELNSLQQRIGTRLTLEQASAFGLVDQTLQRLVTGALLDQQAQGMGLTVSEDQIRRHIAEDPSFRDSAGRFDPNRFERLLRSNSLSEQEYVATLRLDIQRQQLTRPLLSAATAPTALAETLQAYRGERRSAEVIEIARDAQPKPPPPDEATLETYYQENSNRFMAPETWAVTFVSFGPDDLADEITVTEEEAREAFESRRDELATPERRQLSQLVFPDQAGAQAAYQALGEGRSFETVAEETLGKAPVDLGLQSRADLEAQLPVLADSAFAVAAGEVSAPVESPFGWHIVKVSEIEPAVEPGFEDVREELISRIKQERAVESVVSLANQVDDELAGGASLEEVAERLALPLRRIPAIDISGNDASGERIEDLPARTEFLSTMAETEESEESLLTDSGEHSYFILRVDAKTPSTLRPLAEVREEALEGWEREERQRLAEERAAELAKRAEADQSLAEIAEAESLTVKSLGPYERSATDPDAGATRGFVETLFGLDEDEVATAEAPEGSYVVKLTAVEEVSPGADEAAVARVRGQLSEQFQDELFGAFSEALRREHGVSVNRSVVEELVRRY